MTKDPISLAWLAGVFEVGGSVTLLKRPRGRGYASVQFEGNPYVVRRVADLAGSGGISSRSPTRDRWTTAGAPAWEFLAGILPHVHSPARRKKIQSVIDKSIPLRKETDLMAALVTSGSKKEE